MQRRAWVGLFRALFLGLSLQAVLPSDCQPETAPAPPHLEDRRTSPGRASGPCKVGAQARTAWREGWVRSGLALAGLGVGWYLGARAVRLRRARCQPVPGLPVTNPDAGSSGDARAPAVPAGRTREGGAIRRTRRRRRRRFDFDRFQQALLRDL
jgi:hypothetical protein